MALEHEYNLIMAVLNIRGNKVANPPLNDMNPNNVQTEETNKANEAKHVVRQFNIPSQSELVIFNNKIIDSIHNVLLIQAQ